METNNKPTTCKKYIWSELTAGRSVTHLSVLRAIGSIKCQQRIFDLRRDLERKNSTFEIITTMVKSPNGAYYAKYSLKKLEPTTPKLFN